MADDAARYRYSVGLYDTTRALDPDEIMLRQGYRIHTVIDAGTKEGIQFLRIVWEKVETHG